jgi:hypothetical protein
VGAEVIKAGFIAVGDLDLVEKISGRRRQGRPQLMAQWNARSGKPRSCRPTCRDVAGESASA